MKFITENSEYAKIKEQIKEQMNKKKSNKRARSPSPVRDNLTLTPEELEDVLGAYIPRRPSLLDFAKSMFGKETTPKYNPRDVQIARIMAQSILDKDIEKKEQHYLDELLRTAAQYENKKTAEDAKLAAIARQNEMRSRPSHAAAQQLHKEQLRNHITDQNVRDAQSKYQDLRVAAYNSATTNKFVHDEHSYPNLATQRDAARLDLEALKARQAAQPQQEHERSMNAFNDEINQRERRKFFERLPRGGKSKRVKSKRNKRSTKRRNARK